MFDFIKNWIKEIKRKKEVKLFKERVMLNLKHGHKVMIPHKNSQDDFATAHILNNNKLERKVKYEIRWQKSDGTHHRNEIVVASYDSPEFKDILTLNEITETKGKSVSDMLNEELGL